MSTKDPFGVRFTQFWVATYTGGLPPEPGERRRLEIASDLHEQLQEMGGTGILGRSLRGIPADVWWRVRTLRESANRAERSLNMSGNPRRGLWMALVVIHVVVALFGAVTTLLGGGDAASIMVPLTVVGLIGLALIAGGIFVQRRRFVTGSWLILVGLIPGIASLTGPLVLISGLWTANLVFKESTLELDYQALSDRRAQKIGQTWWVWLVAALLGVGVGFLALLLDPQDFESSLLWAVWILSWLAAALMALIGVGILVVRIVGRHRTRAA